MADPLARLHRLRPDFDEPSCYTSHRSKFRHDPEARAAVDLALRHIEIRADRFQRVDLIQAAQRLAAPGVTTFRIAADLQRLLLGRVGVFPTSLRPDRAGPELTSSTAMAIKASIALEIDAGLCKSVFLLPRAEAMELLAHDCERRHVVLAPDPRGMRDLSARCCGVEAILARVWITRMDRTLSEPGTLEPLRRSWLGRTLLVDRARALPNVDVLLILEISRRLGLGLILVDDTGRFRIEGKPITHQSLIPRTRPLPKGH